MQVPSLFMLWSWWLAACLTWSVSAPAHAVPPKQECLATYASAQELRLNGALLAARDKLLVCSQRGCPGPIVNDCAGWLNEIENALPSVVFAVSGEDGRDIVDARASVEDRVLAERSDGHAVEVDPGTYTFSIEADGHARAEQTVSIRQSEKNRIVRVQLHKLGAAAPALLESQLTAAESDLAAPGRRVPVASIVLGSVAVLGGATFAYFGVRGLDAKHEVDRCRSMCRGLIDDGRRDYMIADVGLGVAVASASAAVLLYLLTPNSPAPTAEATGPLSVSGRF